MCEIFLLLLQLRQSCCNLALIYKSPDKKIVKQLYSKSINNAVEIANKNYTDSMRMIMENLHFSRVLNDDFISSKTRAVIQLVKDIVEKGNDKLIIVSQWTQQLHIIASHLHVLNRRRHVRSINWRN